MNDFLNETLLPPPCYRARQCSPVNIARQVPLEWAVPLYGYTMPLIVSITVATNSFIVVILSHKYLRTPTNFVLLAMAISELLTGLCCIPWFLYYYTFGGYRTDAEYGLPKGWCVMIPYMAFVLPSIFHTTAIWLTVYLAIQRYIYICIPTLVRRFCTLQKCKRVILFIWIPSILLYAPDAFANYYQSKIVFNPYTNRTTRVCYRTQTSLLLWMGQNLYYKVFYTVHTCFAHFLPCLLLVIFTWKLVRAIRVADKRHANLVTKSRPRMNSADENSSSRNRSTVQGEGLLGRMPKIYRKGQEPKRVQGLKQNTRMLIVVILLFLLTEVPAACIFSVHVLSVSFQFNWGHYHLLNILLIVRNVLIVTTYPFRFAIYCGMSQQFRDVVRQMFVARLLPRHTKAELVLTANGGTHTKSRTLSKDSSSNFTASAAPLCITLDHGVQCDRLNYCQFDPIFDDIHAMLESDPEEEGTPQLTCNARKRSRGTQCSAKIDQELFVRRRSSFVQAALQANAPSLCTVPLAMSIQECHPEA